MQGEVSLDYLCSLYGKKLGCYCKPEPCHGDVVKSMVDYAVTLNSPAELVKFAQDRLDARRDGWMPAVEQNITSPQGEIMDLRESLIKAKSEKASALDKLKDAQSGYDSAHSGDMPKAERQQVLKALMQARKEFNELER